jgi:parvulin-like peptidyl-prolyl isomerase
MLRTPRSPLVALAAMLLLGTAGSGIAGCKSCNEHALEVQAADAGTGSLTPEQAAKVLVRIDDQTITLGDFAAALAHMDPLDRLRYQAPARRRELLNDMINLRLLAKEAHDKGYDQDPTALEAEREVLRNAMLAEARKGALTADQIPAADVHDYFEAHRAEYKDPERRRVSVIVLNDEATAKQVLEQVKKAGPSPTAFGELVRAKSVDPEAKNNVPVDLVGDLGIVSPPGDPRGDNPKIKPEVRAALFQIPAIGEVAPAVVPAGGQFYIVKMTQRLDPHDRPFAEAERTIRVKLSEDAVQRQQDALLAELKTKFPVTIDEAALATVRVDVDGGGMPPSSAPDGG